MDLDVFDTNNLPLNSRIVVAMSGGVDSSLTAAILHKMGYEVIGVTLKLYDGGESSCSTSTKRCCASRDIEDARKVAEKIGFPHYVMNYQSRFNEEVVNYFVDSYSRGETPLPCVKCNQSVKFVDLLDCAKKLNADALATGHYVKRIWNNGKAEMHKPKDATKDQTYFLFGTTQEQLNFLCFPLSNIDKSLTRNYAQYFGLDIASKPDSQDICFVPNGNYADFISKVRPSVVESGNILNKDGKIIGQHDGTVNYTIGQRKGIKVSADKPFFVVKINAKKKNITVGSREDLAKKYIFLHEVNLLEDINYICGDMCSDEYSDNYHENNAKGDKAQNCQSHKDNYQDNPSDNSLIYVKVRSTHSGVSARVFHRDSDKFQEVYKRCLKDAEIEEDTELQKKFDFKDVMMVELKDFEYGVASGQACVIYSGSRLLGGGWIFHSV